MYRETVQLRAAIWRSMPYDTAQGVAIRAAARAGARRHGAYGTARDKVGRALRHDPACVATRPSQACDTA